MLGMRTHIIIKHKLISCLSIKTVDFLM